MIAVRDLRNPAVALEWHEAVAVVAALTATLWNARAPQAPTLDAAELTLDGDVLITGEGRLAGAVTSGLALALGALLEATPCPAELRHIVTANVGPAPELDSVNAFARALMFFERPGRPEVLRELAMRASDALERTRAAEELERLTERARQRALQSAAPAPAIIAPAAAAVSSARRFVGPAAVGATVFLAVALAAATLFTMPSPAPAPPALKTGAVEDDEDPAPPAPSAPVEAPAAGSTDTSAKPAQAGPSAPGAEAPEPRTVGVVKAHHGNVATRSTASAAAPAGTSAATGTTAPPAATGTAASGSDIVVRVTELGGSPLPVTTAAAGSARGTTRIYTSGDAGVSPAILVKPHLPAEPPSDVPPWEVGTLELTVGTSGSVEQVHLISPYNRYQERMLVAAAKAWLFQPATKDGRPVRFRTRIRVTL